MSKIFIVFCTMLGIVGCKENVNAELACNITHAHYAPSSSSVSSDLKYIVIIANGTVDFIWTYSPNNTNSMNFKAKIDYIDDREIKFSGVKNWMAWGGIPVKNVYKGTFNRLTGQVDYTTEDGTKGYYTSADGLCSRSKSVNKF
jgi:hypothetical protein